MACYRYSLIRVRENAESIAFYGGVRQELNEIERRFGRAVENFEKVIRAQRDLEFFTTGYRYLIQVTPLLLFKCFCLLGMGWVWLVWVGMGWVGLG